MPRSLTSKRSSSILTQFLQNYQRYFDRQTWHRASPSWGNEGCILKWLFWTSRSERSKESFIRSWQFLPHCCCYHLQNLHTVLLPGGDEIYTCVVWDTHVWYLGQKTSTVIFCIVLNKRSCLNKCAPALSGNSYPSFDGMDPSKQVKMGKNWWTGR